MSDLEEQLYLAVNSSDVELLKNTLKKGADVNTLVESGLSILGRAIQIGNEEIIQIMIDAKHFLPVECSYDDANTKRQDLASKTEVYDWNTLKLNDQVELHGSSIQSCSWRGKHCSKSSFSVECKNHRGLGLFHSLRRYAIQKYGCDVNLSDFYDRMPIHYAAESGNVDVVQLLLQAGSRVNVSDNNNITPLHLAVSLQHEAIVELLLKAGSRVNSKTSDKCSALHIACSRGFLKIVHVLLRHGANIEILDASERTPLLVAASRSHYDVVKLLLLKGAKTNIEEIHGYTPLSEAVWHNDMKLVQTLLEAGANANGHHHLLHYTVRQCSLPLCKLLVKSGAFVNTRDGSGDSPLHIAVRTSQIDIVKLLLHCGSSATLRCGSSGKTPIHIAVECIPEVEFRTFLHILELLISFGGNFNTESYTAGDTPLYRSILLDKFLFAEELIRCGCDPNLGNVFSCNIDNLCFAVRKKHFRTVKLLIYSGFFLQTSPCLATANNNINTSEIQQFLMNIKTNPMALSKLCRIVVRQCLKENMVFKISKLQLPTLLKDYLLFNDSEFS